MLLYLLSLFLTETLNYSRIVLHITVQQNNNHAFVRHQHFSSKYWYNVDDSLERFASIYSQEFKNELIHRGCPKTTPPPAPTINFDV